MGYHDGARGKRVPAAVWGWSPPLRRAYLTGLAEADGHLQHDAARTGPTWRVGSVNRPLLEDARDLALTCGIRPTTVVTDKPQTYQPPHSPAPITSTLHTVGLTFGPDAAEGRSLLSQTSGHPDPQHLRYEVIRKITPGPAQPVYDLTVEGTESFIAEGYAVHNTRWHQDDLSGRILSRPSPLRWRVLSMPAIAGPRDPLGRAVGQEFPSVRGREAGHFARLKATMTPYVFSGIYQQDPVAAEGNFFRRAAFRYWRTVSGTPDPGGILAAAHSYGAWVECEGRRVDLADPGVWRFATVDVAASTRTMADWTVVAVWAITPDGDLLLLDRARAHVEMADHFGLARPLRDRWRFDQLYVERQFYSKTLVADARTAGIPVTEVVADTDKITRAIPAAGRTHAGRAWFPADAPWLEEWESELASFPAGAHDDQVDTFSYAARIAAAHWVPRRSRSLAGLPARTSWPASPRPTPPQPATATTTSPRCRSARGYAAGRTSGWPGHCC